MNNGYLNKFFTKKRILEKIFDNNFQKEEFIKEVNDNYKILKKEYRNEFFFKTTLFNKYLLGRYSISTSVAFSEMSVGKSKADFCIINKNKAMVFEIKTDLDNLDRLAYQIADYYKVFSYVSVVTTETNYYPVWKIIKDYYPEVGIIVLTENVTLSERKKATLNNTKLDYLSLFKLLRKPEYEGLIRMKFNVPTDIRPVENFQVFFSYFRKIDILDAQKMVFNTLKKRVDLKNSKQLNTLPTSIRWLLYSANLKSSQFKEIEYKFKD